MQKLLSCSVTAKGSEPHRDAACSAASLPGMQATLSTRRVEKALCLFGRLLFVFVSLPHPPIECFSMRLSRKSGSMPACPKMQEIGDGILSVNSEAGGAQGRFTGAFPDRARLQAVNKGPLWQFASCFCQI